MNYSLNFKPRFMFGIIESEDPENHLFFNFYDYDKNKDIKCYERDGKTEVSEETVSRVLNKFCSENKEDFVYTVKYSKLVDDLGELWRAQAIHKNGHLIFFGYSQFSAHHAVEDLENAKNLIMHHYFNAEEAAKIQEEYNKEIEERAKAQIEADKAAAEAKKEETVEGSTEEEKVEG